MPEGDPLRSLAITGLVALALGACGSSERAKCEQVAKRELACDPRITDKRDFDRIAGKVAAESCNDPEVRALDARAAVCLSEPTCAAYHACVDRTALRDQSLDGKGPP